MVVLFTITNPVVDYEEEDQNWRQYLQMLQCLTAPIFFVFGADCMSQSVRLAACSPPFPSPSGLY